MKKNNKLSLMAMLFVLSPAALAMDPFVKENGPPILVPATSDDSGPAKFQRAIYMTDWPKLDGSIIFPKIINEVGPNGFYPLLYAIHVFNGFYLEVIKFLVSELGADTNVSKDGHSALYWALKMELGKATTPLMDFLIANQAAFNSEDWAELENNPKDFAFAKAKINSKVVLTEAFGIEIDVQEEELEIEIGLKSEAEENQRKEKVNEYKNGIMVALACAQASETKLTAEKRQKGSDKLRSVAISNTNERFPIPHTDLFLRKNNDGSAVEITSVSDGAVNSHDRAVIPYILASAEQLSIKIVNATLGDYNVMRTIGRYLIKAKHNLGQPIAIPGTNLLLQSSMVKYAENDVLLVNCWDKTGIDITNPRETDAEVNLYISALIQLASSTAKIFRVKDKEPAVAGMRTYVDANILPAIVKADTGELARVSHSKLYLKRLEGMDMLCIHHSLLSMNEAEMGIMEILAQEIMNMGGKLMAASQTPEKDDAVLTLSNLKPLEMSVFVSKIEVSHDESISTTDVKPTNSAIESLLGPLSAFSINCDAPQSLGHVYPTNSDVPQGFDLCSLLNKVTDVNYLFVPVVKSNSNIVMWQIPNTNIIKYFVKSAVRDESLLKSLSFQAGKMKFTLVEAEGPREYLTILWTKELAGNSLDDHLCALLLPLSCGDVDFVDITNSIKLKFNSGAIIVEYSDKTELELRANLKLNTGIVSLLKNAALDLSLDLVDPRNK